MGVKFNREYEDIIEDMIQAMRKIDDCYSAFEMGHEEWSQLDDLEKTECLRTLSDDIFFGLGSDPEIQIGKGKITYVARNHTIHITANPHETQVIRLV